MSLPHGFKRIQLHPARSKQFPSGSSLHGYQLIAPLDKNGHIDARLGRSIRSFAMFAASGRARPTRSAC